MTEQEDLAHNEFFQKLSTEFVELCVPVKTRQGLILVPRQEAILGIVWNRNLFETHLLVPSPYFQGVYVSLNGKELEVEGRTIRPRHGFLPTLSINVIGEELHYNDNFQPFRVLVIESPLEAKYSVRKSLQTAQHLPNERTAESYIEFLESFSEHSKVIEDIKNKIGLFMESYFIVLNDPRFEEDLVQKLKKLIDDGTEGSRKIPALKPYFHIKRKEKIFQEAWECFVMYHVHPKLFTQICRFHESDHDQFLKQCDVVANFTPEVLGLTIPTFPDLSIPIATLKNINAFLTPLEKVICLKETLDLIAKCASSTSGDVTTVVGTDDLLPLFVYTLLSARVDFIHANSHYIELLYGGGHIDETGFAAATLKAALHFISEHTAFRKHTSFAENRRKTSLAMPVNLPLRNASHQRQNTPKDISEISTGFNSQIPPKGSLAGDSESVQINRQKSSSRLQDTLPLPLIKSDLHLKPVLEDPAAAGDLGDFLSALQDSDDTCSSQFSRLDFS